MRSRYKIDPNFNTYFVTSTTIDWVPLILNNDMFLIILGSFKFCQENKGLSIYAYVIMPNHFHAIISMDDPNKISDVMRDLKRYTSQEITDYIKDNLSNRNLFWLKPFFGKKVNNVWQEGYHPVLLKSRKWFVEKLEYIHSNPVEKGFVERPEHWKYSTARNYLLEDHSLFKVDSIFI